MEDTFFSESTERTERPSAARRTAAVFTEASLGVFGTLLDSLSAYARIIRKEIELFLGAALFVMGVFGFRVDRFCDGNTADYLSCTRPSAYYYYGWFEITLIVCGVFLILLWVFAKQSLKK